MAFKISQLYRAKLVAAIGTLTLLVPPGSVHAQDQSPALDRVSVWLGAYYPHTRTTIGGEDKSGIAQGAQGDVNLEKDLGFRDHKAVPRARIDFLIGDSQGFSFDYFSLNRTRTKTLSDGISYGGNDYSASASVRGKVDFDFGSAAYRWWFGSESSVFGLGVGAAYYRVHAGISGDASYNGESIGSASAYTKESAWAPELQVGWRHAFNDQWRIYLDASGVKRNGGNLYGHIYNAALGLEWFPWKNVGLGAEYNYTRIKLHDDKRDYDADLHMKLNGPSAFIRFRF